MRVFRKKVSLRWINKRRRERSSRHDKSQTKHIPLDLTMEILSRLPVKSIVRFGCVSKLWSTLTRHQSFINLFASRSSSGQPRLLVTFSTCYKKYGYDPLEGKHKVLCIVDKEYSEELQVLTLGAQESWRVITKGIPMHFPTGGLGRCFNGILYYEARLLGDGKNIIMSFDVKSESFSPIKYPEGPSHLMLDIIQGRLAMVAFCSFSNIVDLYILKDEDGHEWTHQRFLNIFGKSKLWLEPVYFKGITDDGELVFAPNTFPEPYYIIYFDPKKNSTREALFQGVKDVDMRFLHIPCKRGWGTGAGEPIDAP
ncbi:BnaA09g27460D [Brassica napus]|uniref:(rape) hypothetical protein n=1 Tax=Brassica napus TaxID=3708 RepID=A0A078IBB0_BRANA|nr:unnamed protein product [Brassica napus]CDY46619.1 BnaA09g27460D [Brassica napus]